MISVDVSGSVCHLSGSLTQDDVVTLWSGRQSLIPDTVDTLELSGLSYSDSAGIAFLLALWQLRHKAGRPLTLSAPSQQVANLIDLYDLQACFALPA